MALHLTDAGRRMLHGGADRVQSTLDRLEEALSAPGDEEADYEDFLALGALWYYVLQETMRQKDTVDLSELHREAQMLQGYLTSDSET